MIAAEGEHKASRALRHAAEVIMENPAALQVRPNTTAIVINMEQPYSALIFLCLTGCYQSYLKLLQLRYLQTLNGISAENNSTIIFPVPVDILSTMMNFNQVSFCA